MGGALDLDDLDAALNGLGQGSAKAPADDTTGDVPPGSPAPASATAAASVPPKAVPPAEREEAAAPPVPPRAAPPPLVPPPVRPKKSGAPGSPSVSATPGQWNGRVQFDDLFVSDTVPSLSARAGLEEKVEYFREKLKRSEAQGAKFRDAWSTRERELDTLEALLERERGRADEATQKGAELAQKLQLLERFIEQKKLEFEAYGHKVTAAFAQKEEQERDLKRQLADKDGELQGYKTQTETVTQDLEQERRSHQDDNAALSKQLEERDQRIGEIESTRQELEEIKEALERDLGVRNEAIDKLKASIEKQREALVDRDQQIESLSGQLGQAGVDGVRIKTELEARVGELTQEIDSLRESSERDISVRDEAIAKLKEAIERQRAALAERDQQTEEIKATLDTKEREFAETQQELGLLRDQSTHDVQVRDTAIEKLKGAVESQRQALAERDDRITKLEDELANLSKQLTDLEGTQQATSVELGGTIKAHEQTIEKLRTALEATRTRLQELDGELTDTQGRLAEAERTATADRERYGELLQRTRKALEVAQKLLT